MPERYWVPKSGPRITFGFMGCPLCRQEIECKPVGMVQDKVVARNRFQARMSRDSVGGEVDYVPLESERYQPPDEA